MFRQDLVMSAHHDDKKYYDHIILFYLETKRCRYQWIIFVCFYLYIDVAIFIDYLDIDKIMDINNDKC
jgi:hypothetical protein